MSESAAAEERSSGFAQRFYEQVLNASSGQQFIFVIAVSMLKYGVNFYPSIGNMLLLAQHWTNPQTTSVASPLSAYVLNSPLQFMLAGALHCTTLRSYFLLGFVTVIVAMGAGYCFSRVRQSPETRLLYTTLLLGSAVVPVLFSWVGSPDAFSILGATSAGLARSKWWRAGGWLVFACSNPHQAILAAAVLAVVVLRRSGWSLLATYFLDALGLALGWSFVTLLTHHWGISSSGSLFYYLQHCNYFSQFLTPLGRYFPLIVFSALGVAWLMLASAPLRPERGVDVLLGAAVVTVVVICLIALDETRISVGVLWPALLLSIFEGTSSWSTSQLRQWLRPYFFVALFVPIVVVWSTTLIFNGFGQLMSTIVWWTQH